MIQRTMINLNTNTHTALSYTQINQLFLLLMQILNSYIQYPHWSWSNNILSTIACSKLYFYNIFSSYLTKTRLSDCHYLRIIGRLPTFFCDTFTRFHQSLQWTIEKLFFLDEQHTIRIHIQEATLPPDT